VVLVAQRLERRPVESRGGLFPETLSVANRGSELKARRVKVNQKLDLD